VEPDGVFEVMYPERLDIDEMGDDVRVRDKASARFGKLSAEARARRMRGEEGAKRADAGERLTAAVTHHLGTDHAPDALLAELMGVIREEKGRGEAREAALGSRARRGGWALEGTKAATKVKVTVTKNRTEGVARGGTPPPRGRSWPPRSSAGRCALRR
jgi:hypothetical protein